MSRALLRRPLFWIAMALILAAIGYTLVRQNPALFDRTAALQNDPRPAAPVLEMLPSDLAVAAPQDLRRVLPLTGTIEAVSHAVVKARVGGEIEAILVREGDPVTAGSIVARMNTREYQARLNQALGALAAAKGQLKIAQAARDNNRALLEKGFISRNAFDTADSQFAIAKANVDSAAAAVDVAREAFADTTLRAPITGVVRRRTVQPGEKVSPDNPLLEIVNLKQLEMAAPVPAAEIASVAVGQEVQVRVEGIAQPMTGKIARINPSTEAGSRSILVYIRLDNPGEVVKSGMFAQAQLTVARRDDVIAVPQSAIRTLGGESFVYGIEDGKVVQRAVTLGAQGITAEGPSVEVQAGLAAGARIVRGNLGALPVGATVRVAGTPANTAQSAASR